MPAAPPLTLPRASARHFAWDLDLSQEELVQLLELTAALKRSPAAYARALAGRYLSLLFEKPSLRTRLTFELAVKQLGGDAVFCNGPIGGREPLKDVARNLDRWTHGIVARVFSHQTIEELARWSAVPVINALSDLCHPCQALADVFTLKERFGQLRGLKLAFVGDGNNVAHSLMLTAPRLGMDLAVATPSAYAPNPEIAAAAAGLAAASGTSLVITPEPAEALRGADAVYTDVWTSMGFEEQADERRRVFQPYQVNQRLMEMASGAVFLHCLPAKRGEEVTEEVIESPRSLVFEQAENRLHTQKALLLMMLE